MTDQNTMNLDELQQKWADYDRKLNVTIRLSRQLLSTANLNRSRWALRRFGAFQVLAALINFAAILAIGSFLGDHITQFRYALPAAALHLGLIALLISEIRQIVLSFRVDYSSPIAPIQKRLEMLRILRIQTTKWTLSLATLAWTPLFIVGLKGFLGIDAYKVFGPLYLAANLVVGLVVMFLAIWLSKKFGDRLHNSPFMQRLMRDIAGYNLTAATNQLAAIAAFQKEDLSA